MAGINRNIRFFFFIFDDKKLRHENCTYNFFKGRVFFIDFIFENI